MPVICDLVNLSLKSTLQHKVSVKKWFCQVNFDFF